MYVVACLVCAARVRYGARRANVERAAGAYGASARRINVPGQVGMKQKIARLIILTLFLWTSVFVANAKWPSPASGRVPAPARSSVHHHLSAQVREIQYIDGMRTDTEQKRESLQGFMVGCTTAVM